MFACCVAGAPLVEVPHDSESSTGGSATSLPEDAVLNPVKRPGPGDHTAQHASHAVDMIARMHMLFNLGASLLASLHPPCMTVKEGSELQVM